MIFFIPHFTNFMFDYDTIKLYIHWGGGYLCTSVELDIIITYVLYHFMIANSRNVENKFMISSALRKFQLSCSKENY